MKHTFQFARSQNIFWVFSDTPYERQRRRWSAIHRTFSSNLGEEWSTHPPAYQDSWFMRDTFTAWDKQSKRMWKVLVKENKPTHFMFGNAFVEILSRMNCLIWRKNCYIAIILPSEFSNVFFKDDLSKYIQIPLWPLLSHLQSLFNGDRDAMFQRRRSYVAFIHLSNVKWWKGSC